MDCGTDFIFTAGEQQFYHEKDFKNEPKRCKACKVKRQNSPSERELAFLDALKHQPFVQ